MQATLRTGRIELVPLADEHLDFEVELDADPEVMRFLGPPRTRAEVEESHRQRRAIAAAAPGLGFWVGIVAGEPVGWWILEPAGGVAGRAALGYRLLRRHWRRGLAGEGARELVRHGFEDLGLTEVVADTMAVNAASRATMAAVGLRYVQTYHEHWDDPLPGTELGEVQYALTRDEWTRRSGA